MASAKAAHGVWLPRMLALLALWLVMLAGCDALGLGDREQPDTTAPPSTSSVPLRILSEASPELNERIEMAWAAVSEQPIEIAGVEEANSLAEPLTRSDVVLFRNLRMGDLQAADGLTPLPNSFLESDVVQRETLLEGLVMDTARWGNEIYGLPLGTVVPAMWVSASNDQPLPETWEEFSEMASRLPDGSVAEPLADGWAGLSFLSRAATLTGGTWLFDRQSFQPVLTEPPYVRALDQMVESRAKYPEELLGPGEIWARLQSGKLQAAIAWPAGGANADPSTAELPRLAGYPVGSEIYIDQWVPAGTVPRQILASPRGLVVGISTSCRQTAAARAFVGWLASRDALSTIRGMDSEVLPNRVAGTTAAGGVPGPAAATSMDPARDAYDDYLASALSAGRLRPSLRIPGADDYLAALNTGVLAALSGEVEPEDALASVSAEWEAITERLGRESQISAWRQSQGMRGR